MFRRQITAINIGCTVLVHNYLIYNHYFHCTGLLQYSMDIQFMHIFKWTLFLHIAIKYQSDPKTNSELSLRIKQKETSYLFCKKLEVL